MPPGKVDPRAENAVLQRRERAWAQALERANRELEIANSELEAFRSRPPMNCVRRCWMSSGVLTQMPPTTLERPLGTIGDCCTSSVRAPDECIN
jgi:hypothetical protein